MTDTVSAITSSRVVGVQFSDGPKWVHRKNNKSYEAPKGAKNDLAIFCKPPKVIYRKLKYFFKKRL